MSAREDGNAPDWLPTDFASIEADLDAMEHYAQRLADDLHKNYAAIAPTVIDSMLTPLPDPLGTFLELVDFLQTHRNAQDLTQQNVYYFADGTKDLADAAKKVSEKYRGSDAFARATVNDIQTALPWPGVNDGKA